VPPFSLLIFTGWAGVLTTLGALGAAFGLKYGAAVGAGVVAAIVLVPCALCFAYALLRRCWYGPCAAASYNRRMRAHQPSSGGFADAFDLFAGARPYTHYGITPPPPPPFFVYLSCHTTHTTTAERRVENQCRRRSASSGQKIRRGIEGEQPGRHRYRLFLFDSRVITPTLHR